MTQMSGGGLGRRLPVRTGRLREGIPGPGGVPTGPGKTSGRGPLDPPTRTSPELLRLLAAQF